MPTTLALAVDLGGTKVEAALVDATGTLQPDSRYRQPTGALSTSAQLEESVRSVVTSALASVPDGVEIIAVGVGSAGPLSRDRGLISPLNLPAWRDYPLRDLVEELVPHHAVELRMDGQCIALAEHWVGAASGVQNLMGMVVSTGIGGGLIINGRTVSGSQGNAGHIGHIEVSGETLDCACGGHGCLEAVASGPRSVTWARARGWAGQTGEDLAGSYAAGDPIAMAAVERAGRAIGRAIGSATSLLDLDVVAIGGGFSRVTPDLFDYIRGGLLEHSGFDFTRRVRVVASALSDEGPLIGAAALVHRAHVLD